ncbi:hypothetical protein QQF54_08480 [Lelliottia sp. V106_10]|uniref:hypothetical protein n=1 Tax=Lelliottia wanjuensis TaxID=3050585 RepID=UPI00254DD988|nr:MULTISPECIES: hypothetical protein [unclassified Lelliottia]MDK9359034.1 hypothetical protein [Lelliottia sp. V106_16]MDK9373390.1 hypothetical protein [Lelliottia sp. V106_10]MDK9600183.1 hypothetical protein [Lelliottia sp. V106_5]
MLESFITTKVRPIRKIFVIEENDSESFFLIYKLLMNEIDGVNNLIFPNNDSIMHPICLEFVNRFDPDVLINFSRRDAKFLSDLFNVKAHESSEKYLNIHRFGSQLQAFTGKPFLVAKYPELVPKKVYSTSKIDGTPKSMFHALNYGMISKKDYVSLRKSYSIFKETQIDCADEITDHSSLIFDLNSKFHNLTNSMGGAYGNSSSIWEINYNRENIFRNEPYVFVSTSVNIPFLLYFWNTRATYNTSKLAWLPIELYKEYNEIINENTVIVYNDPEDISELKKLHPNNKFINPSNYYFHGTKERWIHFEHDQYIATTSGTPMVTHPNEKTFSDIGIGGGYVFEVRGLASFIYPKHHHLGILFQDNLISYDSFPEYFTRLSNKGISKYVHHFSPLENSGLTESFRIPSFKELVTSHFNYLGYSINETSKTFILEQLVNLIKGVDKTNLICDERIFNLLISLTPHNRTEKIIKKELPDLSTSPLKDDLISHIGKLKESGNISIPSSVVDITYIISKLNIPKPLHKDYLNKIQSLYNNKILLRGKSFKCEHCAANIWISLESFERVNFCVECGNIVDIPIFVGDKPLSDYFKLNQLVTRAVDQGQLSTLLLLNYIHNQNYRNIKYISNIEIHSNATLISDIDLYISIGNKMGICECKSNSIFDTKQIDELIVFAERLKCNFIILSCLLNKDASSLIEITKYISEKNVNLPIFIITKEELFNSEPKRLYTYFEVDHRTGMFPSGPILL